MFLFSISQISKLEEALAAVALQIAALSLGKHYLSVKCRDASGHVICVANIVIPQEHPAEPRHRYWSLRHGSRT